MDPLFESGLTWIEVFQQLHGPIIDAFFRSITFMGEEMFYLVVIPFLVWSVDLALGARVGLAFLVSAYINPLLKELFLEPRPFDLDPGVKLSEAVGTGMPSGHSQTSVVVWGTLAWQVGKKWFWGIAVLFMLLIGFSRVFLGVHFPHQVAAGWAVGLVILVAYIALEPRAERWLASLSLGPQIGLALGVPIILAFAFASDSSVAAAAVMAGFGCGLAILRRVASFSAHGVWWLRLVRYLIGVAVLLGLYLGLSALFPDDPDWLYYPLRFVRYGILGVWIGLGAPWLFTKIHLSETTSPPPFDDAAHYGKVH